MHGLWSIALQYTIEYTLCEPSIVIKKGIFRLCSLETKNSRGSTLFQDSKSCPQARNVRNSYSAHAVGFAESAPGCTFCTDLRGLLSANGIPSLAAVYLHTLSVPCIFQSVHFSDIADAPALAIRNFPKYLHNYN